LEIRVANPGWQLVSPLVRLVGCGLKRVCERQRQSSFATSVKQNKYIDKFKQWQAARKEKPSWPPMMIINN